VDLAVPARAAIAEYTAGLLSLCGEEEEDDTFPAVWSLALPGARPLSPSDSLVQSGVVDGATLYLRDVAAGEFDEPVITDLDELVEEANGAGVRWNTRQRALTMLFVGVSGLTAALGVWAASGSANPTVGLGAMLIGIGLALLAGYSTRRGWPFALAVRLAMALAVIPLLMISSVVLPGVLDSSATTVIALSAGAFAGAIAARLAINHVITLTVFTLTGVTLPVASLLAGFGSTRAESAGVVAVLALGALGVVPALSGQLVALTTPQREEPSGEFVPELVRQGRRLLAALTILLSAVLVAALVILGSGGEAYALALAVCVSIALVLRASQLKMTAAVLPVTLAGATGLTTVLLRAPGQLGAPSWAGPLAVLVIGGVLFGAGVLKAFPDAETVDERPAWVAGLAAGLSLVSVPLVVGVFGVFGYLFGMGERM
jgi:type VII secretion integral membrane protein EccD